MDLIIISCSSHITKYLSYLDQVHLRQTNSRLGHYFELSSPYQWLKQSFDRLDLDFSVISGLFPLFPDSEEQIYLSGSFITDLFTTYSYDPTNTILRVIHVSRTSDSSVYPYPNYLPSVDEPNFETNGWNILGSYANTHEYDLNQGIHLIHLTIPYSLVNVPDHFFNLDAELGPVLISSDRAYFQESPNYLHRTRHLNLDREVSRWIKARTPSNYSDQYLRFEHYHRLMIKGFNDILSWIYTQRQQGILIETSPPTNPSVIRFDDLWLSALQRYGLILPQKTINNQGGYGRLLQRKIRASSLIRILNRESYLYINMNDFPHLSRIYGSLKQLIGRQYDLMSCPESQRTYYRYTGPYNIELIRRWFS